MFDCNPSLFSSALQTKAYTPNTPNIFLLWVFKLWIYWGALCGLHLRALRRINVCFYAKAFIQCQYAARPTLNTIITKGLTVVWSCCNHEKGMVGCSQSIWSHLDSLTDLHQQNQLSLCSRMSHVFHEVRVLPLKTRLFSSCIVRVPHLL